VGLRVVSVKNSKLLIRYILIFILFSNLSLKADVNLWINLYSNSEIGWLSEGFVDFILDHYSNNPEVHARKSQQLEKTLAKIRSGEVSQTARNLVLSGAFERKKGEYIVELQLIDVISWKTIADRTVQEKSSDLARLVETVNGAIDEIVGIETQPKTDRSASDKPVISEANRNEPEITENQHTLTVATKNIGTALDALVNAYYEKPNSEILKEVPAQSRKLSEDAFSRSVKGFVEESRSFEEIINRIFDDPYIITIGEPFLRRLPLDPGKVSLSFKVDYQMKNEILKEMIETLRIKNKNEEKDFTEYTFSGNDYDFTNDFIRKVAHGEYRFFPVIALIDEDGKVIARVVDIPGSLNQIKHFNPMFNIAAGPWSMMVYLNKKQQSIDYELTLPIETVAKITQVTIDMINEDDIIALDR